MREISNIKNHGPYKPTDVQCGAESTCPSIPPEVYPNCCGVAQYIVNTWLTFLCCVLFTVGIFGRFSVCAMEPKNNQKIIKGPSA